MWADSFRTVVRDLRFEQMAQACIHPDTRRCDEALAGVEWAIAVAAEQFPRVPDTNLRVVKTAAYPGVPALRVYFTIDSSSQCTLRGVEPIVDPA